MKPDLVILISGAFSCFGIGWALGRWVKSLRQFFDHLS